MSEAPELDPTGISTAALLQPLLPLLGVGPGLSGSPSGEAQKASYSPSLAQEPGAIPPYQAGVPSGDPLQGPCTAAGMEGLALGDLPGIGPIPDASEPQGLGFLVPGADGRPAGPGPGGPILVQEPSAPGAFEIPGIPGIPAIGYPELEGYLAGLAGIAGAPAALPEAPAAQAAPPGAPPEAGAASHSPSLEQEPGGLVPAKPPEGAGKRHWAEGPLPYVGAVPVTKARADFPILSEKVENGREVVWFDNAATTQKPRQVIERLAYFYEHENSNVHRGAHALAARATDAYEAARERVARYLGAKGRDNIVFVRGTTEAINLVAHSYVLPRLSPGDEIIITGLEHHANVVPWQVVAAKSGALLKVAPIDSKGQLIPEAYLSLFGPRTRFVSVTHVSNALGTVNPVASLVAAAHAHGVPILIDGAQSVSHIPVNVTALGADFFVFSGHKIYGPTGIGALYGTDEALQDAEPYQVGGNMIADVTYGKTVYHGPPQKFEAGTGNIADAVGLGAALDYVSDLGLHNIEAYESAILDYATTLVSKLPRVRIIGTAAHKASVLSFVVEGLDTLEVGARLSSAGIAVRAGHHCSQPTVRHFGLEGTVRASLAFYNTAEEVEYFHSVLKGIAS
ncbi:MAG: cysteine desulfurase [Deltaproteobacteria bacterium]|jgi:cysteine desulfurase/selenocysteine lyase|nr:cysteine desulfurase [Deltaproteobacteria bacterium]